MITTALVHFDVLQNDFAYDDIHRVERLQRLHSPPLSLFGRSLTLLTQFLDYTIWGADPFGFHLTNLLLQLIATGLFYAVARRFALSVTAATAAAMLFAVHPVHVEVVTSFVNRKDVLAAVFVFAAFLVFTMRAPMSLRIVGTLLFYGLALQAKEVAAMGLPIVLAVAHGVVRPGGERGAPTRWHVLGVRCLAIIPVLVVIVGLVSGERVKYFGSSYVAAVNESEIQYYSQVLSNVALAFVRIPEMLAFPFRLSPDYPIDRLGDWLRAPVLIGAIIFVTWSTVPAVLIRRHPRASLALGWGLAMYLPASNLIPVIHFYAADRYLYVPSAGVCLLVGIGLDTIGRQRALMRVAALFGVAILVVLGAWRTASSVRDWRSELTLWASAVRAGYDSYRIAHGYGLALINAGKNHAAVPWLVRALRHRPGELESLTLLAVALLGSRRHQEARLVAEKTLAIRPEDAVAHFVRGEALLMEGHSREALADYFAAISADSLHPGALLRIAQLETEGARNDPARRPIAAEYRRRVVEATTHDRSLHAEALRLLRDAAPDSSAVRSP